MSDVEMFAAIIAGVGLFLWLIIKCVTEKGGEGGEPDAAPITLAECPIGLFLYFTTAKEEHILCLKTEYSNNEGKIDAYIISSGEYFWGAQPQSIASQRASKVRPVDPDDVDNFVDDLT